METLNSNICYAFHDTFENLIDNLPKLFEKYDEVDFVGALDDRDFSLLENLVIPNGKVLYINPKGISEETLLDFREYIQGNPGIKLHDEIGQEIDFDNFTSGSRIDEGSRNYADEIEGVLSDSGDLIDSDR